MFDFDFERLQALGLTARLLQQSLVPADDAAADDCRAEAMPCLMRVTAVHRDGLRLDDGESTHRGGIAPRLARILDADGAALTVGDWVLATATSTGERLVVRLLAPINRIVRRDAHGRRHPLVSNVDTALLTMGLDDDFSLRRIERYVSLVSHCGVRPVVVLTKADTVVNAQTLFARQRLVRERLGNELPLLCVDARDADTALRLRPFVEPGHTLVLLGSSGAGKSTLANALLGRAQQETGDVRRRDGRGQHTTRSRSLLRLPQGGCIIDTPGLRALRADADAAAVAAAFGDIQSLATSCRFRNCTHRHEPDCAVRAAIDSDRLGNYQKLLREAARDSSGPLERRQQLAVWKARTRAMRQRQRDESTQRKDA
ncbi:ribosome small subunit-dependent GTPase A [Piscinibacter sakaiensis]|uniref:ribosome small subunit-dependent GTPase A n=1 Tax=Piscinibacter sakaiensis TaxID=1547922 RepID=UPI003AAC97A3